MKWLHSVSNGREVIGVILQFIISCSCTHHIWYKDFGIFQVAQLLQLQSTIQCEKCSEFKFVLSS
jgi:hypothetical protein